MNISSIKWLRLLLLTSIYVLGVLGIVGSSGGGSSEFEPCKDGACDCIADPLGCQEVEETRPHVNSIAVALDSSDDVYFGGSFTTYKNFAANSIARLNNNGPLDTGFITGTGFNDEVLSVAPANDVSGDAYGDVYVGGYFTSYNGSAVGGIARLNLDGTLDTFFDTGTGFNNVVKIIAPAIDDSGDVYVGGSFTSYNGTSVGSGLIRLNDNGSIDAGFSTGSGWGEEGIAPATDGIGNFYVYVARSTSPGIARLNDNGSIDTGFDTGLFGFNNGVRAIAVAIDGSIYAAGNFTDYNGTGTNDLARLHPDGSLDSGFDTGAGLVGTVESITPAIDGFGDIYVGGQFLDYDGTTVGSIARLNLAGTLDTNFDTGTGFNDATNSVALATDGSGDVYVGGWFTRYKSSPVARMVRLTAGGAFVR